MEKISRKELARMYDNEVKDSKLRYADMILDTEFNTEEYSPNISDAVEWVDGLTDNLDTIDKYIDGSIKHKRLDKVLKGYQSKDIDMKQMTEDRVEKYYDIEVDNIYDNECQKEFRKIFYEDAKERVARQFKEDVDLESKEELMRIWCNAKVRMRNDMTALIEDYGKLSEIEDLINERNSLD